MTETTKEYNDLRSRVLAIDPSKAGFEPSEEFPSVWGVLMEIGHATTSVTLVVLADRTVSLYFGSGGGVVGGGPHENVWMACKELLAQAENARASLQPSKDFPLPLTGMIRFHVMSHDGKRTGHTSLEHLETGKDPLMHLFIAGNAVLTELKSVNENQSKSNPGEPQ